MKNLFLFSLAIVFFSGCVMQSEYDKVVEENEELKIQIDELLNGAERIYDEFKAAYDSSEFEVCKAKFELIASMHPGCEEQQKMKPVIDNILKEEARILAKKDAERKALDAKLNRWIRNKYDEFQKITFYETKRETYYQPKQYGPRFNVEIYFGKNDGGNKYFRLRTGYKDDDWMFYKKVELLGDNGAILSLEIDYPEKETDSGSSGVREWSDNSVNVETILELNESKTIKFRFDGKYRYTYAMSWSQRQAFKEVVAKYESIK